jgi:hypothetical protein
VPRAVAVEAGIGCLGDEAVGPMVDNRKWQLIGQRKAPLRTPLRHGSAKTPARLTGAVNGCPLFAVEVTEVTFEIETSLALQAFPIRGESRGSAARLNVAAAPERWR